MGPLEDRPVGRFASGLLVAHDQPDDQPGVGDRDTTGFSYVSWRKIARALGLVVDTDHDNDPRLD